MDRLVAQIMGERKEPATPTQDCFYSLRAVECTREMASDGAPLALPWGRAPTEPTPDTSSIDLDLPARLGLVVGEYRLEVKWDVTEDSEGDEDAEIQETKVRSAT